MQIYGNKTSSCKFCQNKSTVKVNGEKLCADCAELARYYKNAFDKFRPKQKTGRSI